MTDAQKKALLEGGRVLLLSLVSYLLTDGIVSSLLIAIFGIRLDQNSIMLIATFVTTLLRSLDKYLHEIAEEPGFLKEQGLTNF